MRRLFLNTLKFSVLAAAIFVVSAAAQDDPVSETRDQRQLKETKADEPRFNSFLIGIVVNDNGDTTDAAPGNGICETATGNGICTLRAAVAEANALAGDDTITFDPSVTSISVNGQIAISSNMTIIGNGPGVLTISNIAPLSATSRIFNITNFVVNLHGMTLTGGNLTGSGGAIQNTGNLTVTNCVVRNNLASSTGGGIRSTNNFTLLDSVVLDNFSTASTSGGISFAGANLTIANSTIAGNRSFGNGGGINISATASATIRNATIRNNTAGASSGGIFTNRGIITNTTISGNIANGALATDGGGGVRIQAGTNSVSFVSCTITNNTAPNSTTGARSGLWHETGTVNLSSTIIAANIAQDIQRDGTATLVSGGFNLIGENTSVTTEFPAGLPNGTNYVGTDASPLDPMLAPLANNGGSTDTHALLNSSVAVDKGSAFGTTTDQRGFVRINDLPGVPNAPTGDGSDIGAFEFQSAVNPAGFTVRGIVSGNSVGRNGKTLVVLTDGTGNTRYALTNAFGFFTFENVAGGKTYVLNAQNKNEEFIPIVVFVSMDISDLVINAQP
jgi:hypothetical protein